MTIIRGTPAAAVLVLWLAFVATITPTKAQKGCVFTGVCATVGSHCSAVNGLYIAIGDFIWQLFDKNGGEMQSYISRRRIETTGKEVFVLQTSLKNPATHSDPQADIDAMDTDNKCLKDKTVFKKDGNAYMLTYAPKGALRTQCRPALGSIEPPEPLFLRGDLGKTDGIIECARKAIEDGAMLGVSWNSYFRKCFGIRSKDPSDSVWRVPSDTKNLSCWFENNAIPGTFSGKRKEVAGNFKTIDSCIKATENVHALAKFGTFNARLSKCYYTDEKALLEPARKGWQYFAIRSPRPKSIDMNDWRNWGDDW